MNTFKEYRAKTDNFEYAFEVVNFSTYCLVRMGGELSLHPGWNVDKDGDFVPVEKRLSMKAVSNVKTV